MHTPTAREKSERGGKRRVSAEPWWNFILRRGRRMTERQRIVFWPTTLLGHYPGGSDSQPSELPISVTLKSVLHSSPPSREFAYEFELPRSGALLCTTFEIPKRGKIIVFWSAISASARILLALLKIRSRALLSPPPPPLVPRLCFDFSSKDFYSHICCCCCCRYWIIDLFFFLFTRVDKIWLRSFVIEFFRWKKKKKFNTKKTWSTNVTRFWQSNFYMLFF